MLNTIFSIDSRTNRGHGKINDKRKKLLLECNQNIVEGSAGTKKKTTFSKRILSRFSFLFTSQLQKCDEANPVLALYVNKYASYSNNSPEINPDFVLFRFPVTVHSDFKRVYGDSNDFIVLNHFFFFYFVQLILYRCHDFHCLKWTCGRFEYKHYAYGNA